MRESKLEKYIKDYAYDKTGESVYLHLEDAIRISHITKRGSITLAILWANILQHPKNFPPDQYPYQKFFDSPTGGDRLILKAEKINFTVFMASGSLVLEGPYIYDWFTRRFKSLLDNYDESFDKTWTFIPTPTLEVKEEEPTKYVCDDQNTEIEDYLLLRMKHHAVGTTLDKRMEEHAEDYISGLGNMALDQPLFEREELEKEVQSLSSCAIKDGMTYLHKLWKSLLNKWLSCPDTKVYMATPELDSERLQDIINISLHHQYRGHLEVIYTNLACDPESGRNVEQVKMAALKKYEAKHKTYVEYKILHRILMPLKRVNARFMAGVGPDGQAEVIVTSAVFHGKSFVHDSLETVSVLKMEGDAFMEQFVNPMSTPVMASVY